MRSCRSVRIFIVMPCATLCRTFVAKREVSLSLSWFLLLYGDSSAISTVKRSKKKMVAVLRPENRSEGVHKALDSYGISIVFGAKDINRTVRDGEGGYTFPQFGRAAEEIRHTLRYQCPFVRSGEKQL